LSRLSGLFVAASITTPIPPSKPSISLSNWFKVCSRSSFPPNPLPLSRFLPIVSISSINTIHGAFSFACLNKSRILEAPIPTNISTNSEPDIEKNGTFASPATAFARSVFPVPGGPTKSAPLGICAPIFLYFSGLCKKSTISVKASFASSWPATSLNLFPLWADTYILALLFPNCIALPPIRFCIDFIIKLPNSIRIPIGIIHVSKILKRGEFSLGITLVNSTFAFFSLSTNSGSSILPVMYIFLSLLLDGFIAILLFSISTDLTFPVSNIVRNFP